MVQRASCCALVRSHGFICQRVLALLALLSCAFADINMAADADTETCAGACCKSEPTAQQKEEWEMFLREEFDTPPQSILDMDAGESLSGLWFFSRCNATSLTSIGTWQHVETEQCFDANRHALLSTTRRSAEITKHTASDTEHVMSFLENNRLFDFIILSDTRAPHYSFLLAVSAVRLLRSGGVLLAKGYSNSHARQFVLDAFAASHEEIIRRVYCGDESACFRKENIGELPAN
jgi:hypothetical protein